MSQHQARLAWVYAWCIDRLNQQRPAHQVHFVIGNNNLCDVANVIGARLTGRCLIRYFNTSIVDYDHFCISYHRVISINSTREELLRNINTIHSNEVFTELFSLVR